MNCRTSVLLPLSGGKAGVFVHALVELQAAFPLLVQTKFGVRLTAEYVRYRFVPFMVTPNVPPNVLENELVSTVNRPELKFVIPLLNPAIASE